ncbi:aminotransferase family protein-like protein [Cercophora scortea]|uniref:Aminotransferase family protein-like protein n=1 Tax=Cercophora scortea TaxID=314031 RepID=A0AAE0MIY2_9PEZI|nr:aminotransferase family protein-like protein [Cercophora scortea]
MPTPLREIANEEHTSTAPSHSSHNHAPLREPTTPFGRPMRSLFPFAPTYTPLNHGSYGTVPLAILSHRERLLREYESRECIFKQFTLPKLLAESRAAVAPLLGAATDEVVFVNNATTGVNTVLRNLVYERGDVIVYPTSIYPACLNTVRFLEETTAVRGVGVDVVYPVEDEEVVERFRAVVERVVRKGGRVRVAVFDTIVSGPGVRVPWERLVGVCRELGVLSLVDGAHAVGHLDMRHTGAVRPDFLVTNCHKWLYAPRGCAVLYVPFANQHLITTCLPTSHGYKPPSVRKLLPTTAYFVNLFVDVSTADSTPFICVPAALKFREDVCGGEEAILAYNHALAYEGGNRVAQMFGTEVLDDRSGSIRKCGFANVKLPLSVGTREGDDLKSEDVGRVLLFIYRTAAREFDTYMQTFFYAGCFWTRFSAQIYLEMADFEWAASTLLGLCERVKKGEWRAMGAGAEEEEEWRAVAEESNYDERRKGVLEGQ